ncbi:MAG: phage tail tape measure protein, partial [Firmicutes bacterium]|nr:phage tail tape measure protein [Bacillota bacterium]
MSKTINVILNLRDKFSERMTEAQKNALLFKTRLESCEGAAQKAENFLNGFAATAVSATAAAVAGMTAFAKESVETYGKFQQSMSNVAGILDVDQTSKTYKDLEKAARDAGKSTTKTAQESADALSYMALAGWSVEDSMNGLMPILHASEATGADLATTSDMVTDSMSALGLKTSELEHYLDVCAKAQNNSNTTLTQMQEAYIACGGTFQAFNTELDESGALLGILATRGIKGSEAGTSLQSILINLTKKSGESAKAMAALGVSAYDGEGNFKGITNVLREVGEAT